ncbi:MAG: hypothetical protein WCO03_00565 [bacterium]
MFIILSVVAVASLLGMMGMVSLRLSSLRRGGVIAYGGPSVFSIIQEQIDQAAYLLVVNVVKGMKFAYAESIIFLHKVITEIKHAIVAVEKKFAGLAESAHDRRGSGKRGSVSLFLKEIEDHQERVHARMAKN